ncbi:PIG-L family deacetylase [Desertihabitans brevis]|uniref:PIG-L family deacetylase n=1 Tax=Desertihabitans brevis TaxID=2268447 RepID=A0A367YXP9_9ACTN|nr:PIG-L family deacetylase [Desertihabitans brevis]RCK69782.1 PIG-L family deacetylase [Desertihabitans brevis]
MSAPFPTDWQRAVVLVAHPDDIDYGTAAAVARWTAEGRTVGYVLASRGEAGIEGLAPEQAGPLREAEQRAAAAEVGVDDVEFLGFPDSALHDTPELRAALREAVTRRGAHLAVVGFFGAAWDDDSPNQSDHIELGHAAVGALAGSGVPLYQQDPRGDLLVDVEDQVVACVRAVAAHATYFAVLDPQTPVPEQARAVVEMCCPPHEDLGGRHAMVFSRV